jgi:predicted RNase H-like HicB family nuclease
MTNFVVVLTPTVYEDEVGYTVHVPALPGCVTEGDTLDEALANAKEAISAYLESIDESDRPANGASEIIMTVAV